MGKFIFTCFCAFGMASVLYGANIVLDGKSLDTAKVAQIYDGAKVKIDKDALERVKRSHAVLIQAAKEGHKIYGLTVGVGLNKDRKMINPQGELSDEVIEASRKFNIGLIHAHCGGVGENLDIKTARAVLGVRLNNMLFGGSGVSEEIVLMFESFINNDIIPLIPSFGSMGEADITILGHIGLAMLGEGEVFYKGEKMAAKKALELAGLKKISPYAKDSLSILSSNAYSATLASLATEKFAKALNASKLVYALSLEAYNGNVTPFLEQSSDLRPFGEFVQISAQLREILKGSYLWDEDGSRALQDPLSYRDGAYILSTMQKSLQNLREDLKIQLNSSDDNPGVSIKQMPKSGLFSADKVLTSSGTSVVPTANFEPIIWVLDIQHATLALAHNSKTSALRTIKLSDDKFTNLTRFLGTPNSVHALGAMQKPFVALVAQNEHLANPVSLNFIPVAGDIEDVATNAPLAVMNLNTALENYFSILGMELLHAAQAIDLRLAKNPKLKLSDTTKKLYDDYRKVVKFLDEDRALSIDFENSKLFLKNYN